MRIPRAIDTVLLAALFLFGLTRQDVAATTITCDKPLSTEDQKEFTYSAAKELQCKDDKEIVLAGLRYSKLACDPGKGWIDPAARKDAPVLSVLSEKLDMTCAPLKACNNGLIVGFDKTTMEHIGAKTKCTGFGNALRYRNIAGAIASSKEISCLRGSWIADNKPTGIASTAQIILIECFKTTCDDDKITKLEGAKYNSDTHTLACGDSNFTVVAGQPYNYLTCAAEWTDDKGEIVANATEKIAASCVAKACHESLVELANAATRDTETIRCGLHNHELKIDSSYHSQLICDKTTGWKDEAGTVIKPAAEAFSVKCVEKTCDKSLLKLGAEVKFAEATPVSPATLTCAEQKRVLLVDKKLYDNVMCAKGEKWKGGSRELKDNNFHVSCVEKACHPSLIAGIGADVETSVPNKLTCKDDKKELRIQINVFIWETTVYGAAFTCDKDSGWLDDGAVKVSRAESRITVACVDRTCHESLLNSNGTDQFNFTRDANQTNMLVLSCKDQEQSLYAYNAFYSALECLKEGEWTALGMPANETLTVNCAAKACHDSLATLGDGVHRESNTLTCTDAAEQLHIQNSFIYATNLTCNGTSGWSNGTDYVKEADEEFVVDCVSRDANNQTNSTTTCQEAFELNTTCDVAWEGCQELTIVEPEPSSCPKGTHMFFKKSGADIFVSTSTADKGGKLPALHCDRTSGWRVLVFDNVPIQTLAKGDTIICAAKNPLLKSTSNPVHEATTTTVDDTSTPAANDNKTSVEGSPLLKANADSDALQKEESWFEAHKVLLMIVGGALVGAIILAIAMIVVYKVVTAKRAASESSDQSNEKLIDEKKLSKKERKMRETHGDNDAILDDLLVEQPAELKL